MAERIRLRCPRCRGQELTVSARYSEEKSYDVRDGVIVGGYVVGSMPELLGLEAECSDCGHEWRSRLGESWQDVAEAAGDQHG